MLDKTFDPKATEPRLYEAWERSGAFSPERALARDPAARPFCMVIPPPNVTGSLHIGHALNNTLQDVLARFHRMKGEAVLWLPGTDHAGIATQMVVERQLAAEGNQGRRELGREAFLERVWTWKAESGGTITRQLRRLGASCDWSRERFTLDDGLSAAVRKVFVTLYKEGLIYRDKRLVNWDPQFQTAISDLEVEQREVDGFYWRFAYPLEDGSGEIVVATTRPETMLGDTAVAVHPDDARYAQLVGKRVRLPIADRLIPIVADAYADPEKGSGAVKITPAHDFNDFQVGKRHGLGTINILTPEATLNDSVPPEFAGMDRFVARKAILRRMEELGLLRGIDPTRHVVPHGDRSGAVIEPYLTDQWYVDAKTLAQPAIAAVEDGRTVFEPRNWEKTYFEWMRNIEPWCISRQLWWGHRIPAWWGPRRGDDVGGETGDRLKQAGANDDGVLVSDREDLKVFVAESEQEAIAQATAYYGASVLVAEGAREALSSEVMSGAVGIDVVHRSTRQPVRIFRDEDVLDTWFSSGLWPFSTLGWPEDTDDLRRFYPTDTLVTSFDIIFFWVARMMMMGLHFKDEVPFRRVFINALVRDERGQKMSKSKGNVVDPLELVDQYGADALRFTLTAMSGQARDIKLSTQRVEGYRNFGTKLWNAARFAQMNDCRLDPGFDPATARLPLNRWLRGEVVRTAHAVTAALEACAFDQAADALYRFIWNSFCDWHLELAKPILQGQDEAARTETRAMTAWALDQALRLLHPVSPFLTEALWESTRDGSAFAASGSTGGGEEENTDGSGLLDPLSGQAGGSEGGEVGGTEGGMLIEAAWPDLPLDWTDREADAEVEWLEALIGEGRAVRAELNVPPSARPRLGVMGPSERTLARLRANAAQVAAMLRVEEVQTVTEVSRGSVTFLVEGETYVLPVADYVDLTAEMARLKKAIASAQSDADRVRKKLDNPQFMAKAPEAVVEENRAKLAEAEAAEAKLAAALARLQAVG